MNKSILTMVLAAALGSTVLTACGEKASFATLEDSRKQALINAEYNAKKFRSSNKKYSGHHILMRGDSSIKPDCPQGDGWASIDLEASNGSKVSLKCSTVSGTLGCWTKKDFSSRSYANQEGQCDTNLPHPLPKIAK
jgi:hypothetical protein